MLIPVAVCLEPTVPMFFRPQAVAFWVVLATYLIFYSNLRPCRCSSALGKIGGEDGLYLISCIRTAMKPMPFFQKEKVIF